MQNAKKRNLILTLLVGLLMSVLAFVGISLSPKTVFADTNFDGSELLGDKVQVGDSLVGKTIKLKASASGGGDKVTIKTQNYAFEFVDLDPISFYVNGELTTIFIEPNFTTAYNEDDVQIQYYTFEAKKVGQTELIPEITNNADLTNETVTEIIGDDVYYVETDDSTTTDPEDPGTTPEDPGTTPEDPGTTPEDPGTTPEDPETPGDVDPEEPSDDIPLLPDNSDTNKWGEFTDGVAGWFSENTGLKITGSFVSIALVGLVLILIFKKK